MNKADVLLQSWGSDSNNSQVSDFLEQLEKFVMSLEGARGNMEGQVTLAESEMNTMLNDMKSASDYQGAGTLYHHTSTK